MENIFVQAIRPAMKNDNSAPDDYTDADGLRVCGKCHTRKQTFFEVEGLIPRSVVPCLCKCEQAKQEAERRERERVEAAERIEKMRKRGMADAQYTQCTFAADDGNDAKASAFCRAYVDKWDWVQEHNAGVLLWGDVGGGKTFFAACIANALIDKGVPVVMTAISRLTAAMQADYGAGRADVLDMVTRAPLLILDDVGTERTTSYGMEQAYEIINARYKAKKPLIVTTNLTMHALKNPEDVAYKRIYERIVEMCTPCKVEASGRRQAAARDKMEEMLKAFGL